MLPDKVEIMKSIHAFISTQMTAGVDALNLDVNTNYLDTGMVDSFGLIELIVFVESTYKIKLSDDELISPGLASIEGVASIILEHEIANK